MTASQAPHDGANGRPREPSTLAPLEREGLHATKLRRPLFNGAAIEEQDRVIASVHEYSRVI